MNKTPDYYRHLPYTRRVRLEQDGGGEYFVAFITELPGVEASGPTEAAARAALGTAFDDYLDAMTGWDEEIPEPTPWPQSVGLPVDATVELAPVTMVAMVQMEVGGDRNASFDELADELAGVEEIAREVETVAA